MQDRPDTIHPTAGTGAALHESSARLIAGAMSGTSADGVDVAIVRITGHGLGMSAELVHHHQEPYGDDVRNAIFAARQAGNVTLAELARMARMISLAYVSAVRKALAGAHLSADALSAVAAHGQTLFHDPPNTIQWLDPSLLAAETGCLVVSDFRRADCAAGGQGAPLVPFADYVLFRDPTRHRILLNLGGIANITSLPAGADLDAVIAFDTGPANCISDWVCRTYGPAGMKCDIDGAGASRGRVIQDIANSFLQHAYFKQPPPKSTDAPAMIASFIAATADRQYEINDLLATAASLSATTIADAIARHLDARHSPIELIASGGGVSNHAIMRSLGAALPPGAIVRTVDEWHVPPDAKEAVAFALLGAATLDGFPSNVPSATGAKHAVVLGSVTPRQSLNL